MTPDRHRRHAYEIHTGRDLFGQLTVVIDVGVIGSRGHRLVHQVADRNEAKAVVR